MNPSSYGLHLLLDAYGAPAEKLSGVALLFGVLRDLPERIGMRRVSLPQILEVEESGIAGLSGFVFIMESHISIHTYSERGFLTADVYSCKAFDHEEAVRFLQAAFLFESFESSVVERGLRFNEKRGAEAPQRGSTRSAE